MAALDFGGLWTAAAQIVRREAGLLTPVSGALLFFPQLLLAWRIGDLTPEMVRADPEAWRLLLLLVPVVIISIIGQLAIILLVAGGPDGRGIHTVDALRRALSLLVPAIAASMIQGMAVGFGTLLFILPGFYLMARLVLTIPVLALEGGDPILALKKSWHLTEGQGFRILFMLLLLIAGFLLITLVISGLGAALGFVSTVAAGVPASGWGVGRWVTEIIATAASTAISVYFLAFITGLYRVLAEPRHAR
ncbi:MAG: glycerophosphoryl diester phosphodiesterase membrane domain-containing protein [Sphingomonadaceae bacterium]